MGWRFWKFEIGCFVVKVIMVGIVWMLNICVILGVMLMLIDVSDYLFLVVVVKLDSVLSKLMYILLWGDYSNIIIGILLDWMIILFLKFVLVILVILDGVDSVWLVFVFVVVFCWVCCLMLERLIVLVMVGLSGGCGCVMLLSLLCCCGY